MNSNSRRKAMLRCFAFVCTIFPTTWFILQRNVPDQGPYFINWDETDDISCHHKTEGNALPSAESINPFPYSIFYHETSCRGGLNFKQACSIESAARAHPNKKIYVFFNSPISESTLKRSCLSILMQFNNIKLARLHMVDYAKDTPLGGIMGNRMYNLSEWKVQHTADMLRFITMYKHGGLYLGSDVLVLKPLDSLGRTWICKEYSDTFSIGGMAFGKAALWRSFAETIIKEIVNGYNPHSWSNNGAGALLRALKKFCITNKLELMSPITCNNLKIYNSSVIYPIDWAEYTYYFKNSTYTNKKIDEAYAHHILMDISRYMTVEKDSPYDKLTSKYCPRIKRFYGDKFNKLNY